MTTYQRASSVDAASVIQVIQVCSITGAGVEGDPVRQIVEYYSLTGELLARRDPHKIPCGIPLPTTPSGLPGAGVKDTQKKDTSK